MSVERCIIERLRDSHVIRESFICNGYKYWRYKNKCWRCPSGKYGDKSTHEPVDNKEYNKLLRFSTHDDTSKISHSVEEVPQYDAIEEVPDNAKEDFMIFKSYIDMLQNKIDSYGDPDKYMRGETKSAFEYVSSLMCIHNCNYDELRKKYKDKNYEYHKIFQSVDSTIAHEEANDSSKDILKDK